MACRSSDLGDEHLTGSSCKVPQWDFLPTVRLQKIHTNRQHLTGRACATAPIVAQGSRSGPLWLQDRRSRVCLATKRPRQPKELETELVQHPRWQQGGQPGEDGGIGANRIGLAGRAGLERLQHRPSHHIGRTPERSARSAVALPVRTARSPQCRSVLLLSHGGQHPVAGLVEMQGTSGANAQRGTGDHNCLLQPDSHHGIVPRTSFAAKAAASTAGSTFEPLQPCSEACAGLDPKNSIEVPLRYR